MILLQNLTKTYHAGHVRHKVLDNVSITFPDKKAVAILGRNGAGKSTLLRIIAGTVEPTRGRVQATGTVSFPVGLAQSLHPEMTGAQNARFVARIYGADTGAMVDFVDGIAELGRHLYLPLRSYSSGMKARLSFAINMALTFDTYLVDEVMAVGDAAFRKKSEALVHERLANAGLLYVSHAIGSIRRICTAGALLHAGKLTYFDDLEEAIARHQETSRCATMVRG